MSDEIKPVSADSAEFVREVILKELDYRREKQWRLFSWTSTLLTAIIGGCVALKTRGPRPFAWPLQHKIALSVSVVALTWYACSWIEHNWQRQVAATNEIETYCDTDNRNDGKDMKVVSIKTENKFLTYNKALALLAIAAGVVIWM